MEAQYVRNKFHVVQVRRRRDAAALRLLRARDRALRRRQQEEQVVRGRPSGAAAQRRPRPQGHHPVRRRSRCAGGRLPFPPRGRRAPAGATRRRTLEDVAPAAMLDAVALVAARAPPPALAVRLSLRLDPVRRHPHAARRHAGHPQRRLRQYRRHQRAAHRPQGLGGGDAARRHAQGHRRGADRAVYSRVANLALVAGLGAFLGHLFPVWLRFKGGKGVATYIGVLLGLAWPAALAFCAIWLAVAAVTRYSSLAALVASAATPAVLLATSSGLEPVLFGAADGDPVDHASRQHRAAARTAPKARSGRRPDADAVLSRRALRIVGAHHVVLHRDADVERHQRQQPERQIGVEREQDVRVAGVLGPDRRQREARARSRARRNPKCRPSRAAAPG